MFLIVFLSFTNTDCNTNSNYCRTNVYDSSNRQIVSNYSCNNYATQSNAVYQNLENLNKGLCIEYLNSTRSIIKYELINIINTDRCRLRYKCTNINTCTPAYFINNSSFTDFEYTSCISINTELPPSFPPPLPPRPPSLPASPGFPGSSCDEYSFKEIVFTNIDTRDIKVGPNRLNNLIGSANEIFPIETDYSIYSNHIYNREHQGKTFLEFIEQPRTFPGILNTELISSVPISNPILECCNFCNQNSLKFTRCGGFNVVVNETNIICKFVSTQENIQNSELYLNYSFDDSFRHKRSFSYTSITRFTYGLTQSSPPPTPVPVAPSPSIPPWYFTLLRPEIFIPSLIGVIFLTIIFVYLFRECTSERANAFSSVIDSILGRQKTEVIVT